MIRVLHVVPNMQAGGLESFIMNLYRNVNREKIQFDFLVHYQRRCFFDDEIEKMGGRIYRLSVREDNRFIHYLSELNRFFREHPEYRIVHGHMESLGIFYLYMANRSHVPVRIAHSHNSATEPTFKGTIKNVLRKGFSKEANQLFACSDKAGRFMFGEQAKFTIIHNAINVSKFSYDLSRRQKVRKSLGIRDDRLVLGHVGRFETQKNHKFLIKILAALKQLEPNIILLLIGRGDLMEQIHDQVDQLNLTSNVKFLGVRNDVNDLYQAMDAFILPSLFEGLPVSGIEAQASGLPCFFADTITREVAITPNTKFLSLQESPINWGKNILSLVKNYHREKTDSLVRMSGYDIALEAKRLENYYLELWDQ